MATTANSNLFYKLYSTPNDVASSGFTCSSAVDENDTSFDIDGSEGVITDSNGNELGSIDLSEIHADGITQFNTETRVIQPHSAYLIQGNEFMETYKQQWFRICDEIASVEGYEEYVNLEFDILYKCCEKVHNYHLKSFEQRTTFGHICELVQYMLDYLKVPVTISIRQVGDDDCCCKKGLYDYIVFQSTKEGYEFMIRNVIIHPIMATDSNYDGTDGNYYNSPFKGPDMNMDWITLLFEKFQPRLVGDDTTHRDTTKPNYYYHINCGIYKEFLDLAKTIEDDFSTFCYELDIIKKYFLPLFDKDTGICLFPAQLLELAKKYPNIYGTYFDPSTEISKYNIYDIVEMLDFIKEYMLQCMINGPHSCLEDLNRRIGAVKYPNGACRGIVIIPNWPRNEETDENVLLINHVAEYVELNIPVSIQQLRKYFGGNIATKHPVRLYEKAIANVKINALIPQEKSEYIEDELALPLEDIASNDGFKFTFDFMDVPGYDKRDFINNDFHRIPQSQMPDDRWEEHNNDINYYEPEMYIDENSDDPNIWETNPNSQCTYTDSHLDVKKISIGLYKYMHYLKDNDLWIRVGDAYMVVGKKDNRECRNKNLLQSVLVYNPNDFPLRIKYMIFS